MPSGMRRATSSCRGNSSFRPKSLIRAHDRPSRDCVTGETAELRQSKARMVKDHRLAAHFARRVWADEALRTDMRIQTPMLPNSKTCQSMLVVLALVACPTFAADEPGPLVRAQAKYREARYDEASQLATAAIQRDTESTPAYRLRAAAYEQLGKLDLAIADLSQVIKRQPRKASTWSQRLDPVWRGPSSLTSPFSARCS